MLYNEYYIVYYNIIPYNQITEPRKSLSAKVSNSVVFLNSNLNIPFTHKHTHTHT